MLKNWPTKQQRAGVNNCTCENKERPTNTHTNETSENRDKEKERKGIKGQAKAKHKEISSTEQVQQAQVEDGGFKRQQIEWIGERAVNGDPGLCVISAITDCIPAPVMSTILHAGPIADSGTVVSSCPR